MRLRFWPYYRWLSHWPERFSWESRSVGGDWRQFCVGMAGVLLIIRPGAEGFTIYSIYVVVAVVFVVARDLTARRLGNDVRSIFAAIVGAVGVTIFAGIGSLSETWVAFGTGDVLLLTAAGVFILVAYVCSVMTMRVGEIGFVHPHFAIPVCSGHWCWGWFSLANGLNR